MRPPNRSTPRWFAGCLLAALLVFVSASVFLSAGFVQGDNESVETELAKARELESGSRAFLQARQIYETILHNDKEQGGPLTPDQRARALRGAARCAKLENKLELAKQYWERILADRDTPEDARKYAQGELDEYRRLHGQPPPADASAAQERRRKIQKENRKRATQLVERAKDARRVADYEKALQLVYEALGKDPSYEEAHEEHDRILAERPPRGALLETFMRFVQTSELAEYQSLRASINALHRKGIEALHSDRLKIADQLLRDAILRIDASGFLESGGPRYTETLLGRREELADYLQQAHQRGAKADLTFPPIPKAPDFAARTASLQGQLFALLARLFRSSDARESVRFYRFGERKRAGRRPLLSAQFAEGQRVSQSASALSRSVWAEQHIRDAIGTSWTNPLDPRAADPSPRVSTRDPRILARFGDLLAVQHRDDVQRRVEALRASFGPDATPLRVEVHVYATGAGGTVGATEKLGLRATGPGDGLTLVQRDLLIDECSALLSEVDGILPLGTLDVTLRDTHTTQLKITQLTADHPMFRGMPPPPMRISGDLATYGLHLDLYAEDLKLVAAGLPRCALSLNAVTRMPTHTAIVPRTFGDEMPHTRVPRLGEHRLSTHLEMPHFGTLVVLGLPNPFVPSNSRAPELLLLIGVREAAQAPDPQRTTDERVIPDPYRQREHDLGPLAGEVLDDVIDDAWPTLADASLLPRADRIVARNAFLATMLAKMTGLDDEPSLPISVSRGRAIASLPPGQHAMVERAIQEVRRGEADLYRVLVSWGEVSNADWTQWVTKPEVKEAKAGAFRVSADTPTPISDVQDSGQLLTGVAATLARATQQVSVRRLQERSIVRDIRVEGDDRPRLVPEVASVHQGVIVEVRPGVERTSVRSVALRVRIALWDRIARLDHPATDRARIEVPVWKQSPTGAVADLQITEIVSDDDVIVMGLPVPGNPDQRMVVRIRVLRLK